jgi:plasmid stabilization system protein ParE
VTRIILTPEADADSASIIADLAEKAGARVAARYEADFDRVYDRLADYHQSGAPRPRLGEHVRICVVSPYTIFYEHAEGDDEVMIMRIAHGRRKVSRRFLRGAGKTP